MKKAAVALILVLAALGLAACGGGSSNTTTSEETTTEEPSGGAAESEGNSEGAEAEGGSAAGGSKVAIEANPEGQLAFEQKEVTAKAGKDTIDFTNQSPVPHDVKIESSSGEEIGGTETVSEGSATAVVNLKPGTYTFFCSVPGHREAGMEGTLVVK